MSDRLDELSQLRAEVPPPSQDSLRSMRVRMLENNRPRFWRSQPWMKAGVAGGMALALSAGFVLFQGVSTPSLDGKGGVQFGQPASAQEVLRQAADTVQEQQPLERPRDDQFIYQKTLWRDSEDGDRPGEEWIRFRHSTKGDTDHRTPEMIWEYNESLPTDPDQIRKEIYAEVDRIYADEDIDRDERALWLSATILGAGDGLPAPPEQRAAIFRMMSTIPGVKVEVDYQDILGRPGIYVYLGKAGERSGYIFAEDSYDYLGSHAELPPLPPIGESTDPDKKYAQHNTTDEVLLERKVVDHKEKGRQGTRAEAEF